jgi:hypothetical protein
MSSIILSVFIWLTYGAMESRSTKKIKSINAFAWHTLDALHVDVIECANSYTPDTVTHWVTVSGAIQR